MIPKYIDLQVNGHGGVDLLTAKSADEVRKVSRSLYKNGIAGYLATVITTSLDNALRTIELIEKVRVNPASKEALILGIHLEGPFISQERRGVHPPEHIRDPDLNHLIKLTSTGLIKEVTLAPELPGALDLIDFLVSKNILVSLGHSNATFDQANNAFDHGARTVTHLFNGMPKSFSSGLAQAALMRNDVFVQLIVDNVHIPEDLLLQTIPKILDRFVVTNDPVAAAGMGDGHYSLGEMEIEVKDGVARRSDGTLAGGAATLKDTFTILKKIGISEDVIIASMTTRPSELIGLNYNSIIANLI